MTASSAPSGTILRASFFIYLLISILLAYIREFVRPAACLQVTAISRGRRIERIRISIRIRLYYKMSVVCGLSEGQSQRAGF